MLLDKVKRLGIGTNGKPYKKDPTKSAEDSFLIAQNQEQSLFARLSTKMVSLQVMV